MGGNGTGELGKLIGGFHESSTRMRRTSWRSSSVSGRTWRSCETTGLFDLRGRLAALLPKSGMSSWHGRSGGTWSFNRKSAFMATAVCVRWASRAGRHLIRSCRRDLGHADESSR